MKAISPVIATVIIVAVAIAISIAVALWITGLTSSFTGVEKLEVVNAYATVGTGTQDSSTHNYWTIHLVVKNTGTKPATIDNIFVNNKPGTITLATYSTPGGTSNTISSSGLTLKPGDSVEIIFYLTDNGKSVTSDNNNYDPLTGDSFSSGQTISVVIHTASGGQYPATITLP